MNSFDLTTGEYYVSEIPEINMANLKAVKLTELAEMRWQYTQMFTYDEVYTQCDKAMSVVLGTLELRKRRNVPPMYKQIWKLSSTEFREWTEADIELFGFAIGDFIQACFNREKELAALIESVNTVQDLNNIDLTENWPQQ